MSLGLLAIPLKEYKKISSIAKIDKKEVMNTADVEQKNSSDIIMSGRKLAWRERKLLTQMLLNDNDTYSFTINKTKLNLLMMQKNAAGGWGGGGLLFSEMFSFVPVQILDVC